MHVLGKPAALCCAAPDTVQSPVLNGKHGHAAVVEDHKSLQEQMHHDLWREGNVLTQEPSCAAGDSRKVLLYAGQSMASGSGDFTTLDQPSNAVRLGAGAGQTNLRMG
jgi:hypothetical protein